MRRSGIAPLRARKKCRAHPAAASRRAAPASVSGALQTVPDQKYCPRAALSDARSYPKTGEGAIKRQNYRDAGVDIDAGDALVEAIKPLAKATARAGTEAGLGGFGALFDLKAAGYKDPILVATTDGVGTKLKIAIATGRHDTIGIDLVAMCVNDLVVQGAEPLFFLDYFATGKLDVPTGTTILKGIQRACLTAGCSLDAGETEDIHALHAPAYFSLAGFA